jgi:hypothetical protein
MALPVIAEDRLSLSGEMRVRGWYKDLDTNSTSSWADQRLRIGGKIAVAEGVSITFRTDVTESTWGQTGGTGIQANGAGSGRSGAYQQWDRAHIDLNKGNFHLRAGQQYVGYGLGYTMDTQDNGVAMDYKFGNVPVNAFFILDNNNEGSGSDQGLAKVGNNADAWLTGAKVSPKFDNIALDVFAVYYEAGNSEAAKVGLFGIDTTMNFDAIKVMAEFDYFTGTASDPSGGQKIDAMGTQGFVDVGFAASDAITIGGQAFYAKGAGKNEVQYQVLGNGFNGWDPILDVGTSLSNEETAEWTRPYNFTGDDAGVLGARVYGGFKLNDATHLGASFAYLEPEDKDNTDVNDYKISTIGVTYTLMANTSLQAQYAYAAINESNTNQDYAQLGGIGLFVNF